MNVELTPAEMKSQARAKLEEALKIVARNQAEYSSFYGLLSDDVPTCYVVEYADDADLYATAVLFEMDAIRFKVNTALLTIDLATLAQVLQCQYRLSDPTLKVRYPSELSFRPDFKLREMLCQQIVLRNIRSMKQEQESEDSLSELIDMHEKFLGIMSEISLRALLLDYACLTQRLMAKVIGPRHSAVPHHQAWWRHYMTYDIAEDALVFESERNHAIGFTKIVGAESISAINEEARKFSTYQQIPFHGADEYIKELNASAEIPIKWERHSVDGHRMRGNDGMQTYDITYVTKDNASGYSTETSSGQRKWDESVGEALNSVYAIQSQHLRRVRAEYAILQQAERESKPHR